MTDLFRLQFVYRHLPSESLEAKVFSFLMDRSSITSGRAKERVAEALSAWLGVDALVQEPDTLDSYDSQRQLREAIAALEGRAAYCRSMLGALNASARDKTSNTSRSLPSNSFERLGSATSEDSSRVLGSSLITFEE